MSQHYSSMPNNQHHQHYSPMPTNHQGTPSSQHPQHTMPAQQHNIHMLSMPPIHPNSYGGMNMQIPARKLIVKMITWMRGDEAYEKRISFFRVNVASAFLVHVKLRHRVITTT